MLNGLHEVILYVDDMVRQVKFYGDTLGLAVAYPSDADDFGNLDCVAFETVTCTLALHSGGTDEAVEGTAGIVFEVDDNDDVCGSMVDETLSFDVTEMREELQSNYESGGPIVVNLVGDDASFEYTW